MRELALLGVFILAKLIILLGRPVELSGWTPIAYFWQDLLVAGVFALLDRAIRRDWFGWIVYGAAVVYVAINVPVAIELSSPLTWPMLGAAGTALLDSILHYTTPRNLAAICAVAAAGIALPVVLRRVGAKSRRSLIIPVLLFVMLGPLATSRVETLGRGRNAIMALATTALPRIYSRGSGTHSGEQWRESPFGSGRSGREDLSHLKGAAADRNVVLVSLESTGAQYLEPYGASRDPMPNLSAVARNALVFERAYAVYPESIKGLFSVLCARYPAMDTASESYSHVMTPSLAAVLKAAGYRTALFHSGRFMYLGMEGVVADRGYEVLEDAGAIGGHFESSFGVDEPSTVTRALAWIDSLAQGERFFLTYLPIAGHHPYDTPEPGPFPERAEADRYANALYYADGALGSLIQGLRARGLEDRTLFVIFGDHGEAFGQHDGNYGHSLFLYEENIHVPYLIAAPGLIDRQRVGGTLSLIDTAPTILDHGLHLRRAIRRDCAGGQAGGLFYRLFIELEGTTDGCWKYLRVDSGSFKLFDLAGMPQSRGPLWFYPNESAP
jgi:hypothetical protein